MTKFFIFVSKLKILQKQEFNRIFFWIEEYLFYPKKISQKIVSFLLLPFTAIYCIIVISKRFLKKCKNFHIPIISVGNITIGGNGKTPFLLSLAKNRKNIAIILRGYKRNTTNMLIVSDFGNIKCDVQQSGDEAMLYAKELKNAIVIVSKNRENAIKYAKKKRVKAIFLDDAFHKSEICKFDIILKPKNNYTNNFCLPSGPYREPKSFEKKANIIAVEDKDFRRVVQIKNKTDKMLLITAISKPQRLEKYLPKENIIKKIYFEDHHNFTQKEINNILKLYNPTSLLTTSKDAVKLEKLSLNLSILDLKIIIDKSITDQVNSFIEDFG